MASVIAYKCNPKYYRWEKFFSDSGDRRWGDNTWIKSSTSRKIKREMRRGDLIIAYHCGGDAVGICRFLRLDDSERLEEMILEPICQFEEPVNLLDLKRQYRALRAVPFLKPPPRTLYRISPKDLALVIPHLPDYCQAIFADAGLTRPVSPNQTAAEPVAWEGRWTKARMQRHRQRERRLRQVKIAEALECFEGRLACEVPNCGFDFVDVYGDLGQRYAHVHHLNGLGDGTKLQETKLSDLAIVCPNCHAMIHRGRQCRPLEGLIPRSGESSRRKAVIRSSNYDDLI